jgi:hypothetical protein
MEPIENELTPIQSMQMITEVIAKTKENIKTHSYPFLLWGWLIASASLLFFVLHTYTSFTLFFLPFPVLVVIGIILTIRYYTGSRLEAETYLSFYLKRLWLVLGIAFILVVVISLTGHNTPFTYTLLIAGIGTMASGLALRFRPLVVGGSLFLAFSLVCVVTPDTYKPLLQGVAVVLGYLIPGYQLKNSTV